MKNILLISTRFPLPAIRGDQLIIYNRIVEFKKLNYNISLIILAKKKCEDDKYISELKNLCEITFYPASILDYLKVIPHLIFHRLPFQVALFPQNLKKLNTENYPVAYSFLSRTGHTLLNTRSKIKACEFIDSLGKNFSERSKTSKGFKKLFYKIESSRINKFEQRLSELINLGIAVSESDANEISLSKKILVVPNGVDLNVFKINNNRDKNLIIFSGNLGYLPNRQALDWFIPVFVKIHNLNSNIKLKVVGSDPDNLKAKYLNIPGLIITGFVEDLASELSTGAIAVAPLFAATGIQNKVLEALACGLTVVATSKVIDPLNKSIVNLIFKANTENEFIDAICHIVENNTFNNALTSNKLVASNYSWQSGSNKIINELDGLTEL